MNSLHTAFGRSKKYAAVAMVAALAFLGGCADSEDARSCTQKLDEKEYVAVSEDTSCSTYLRASAYMGRAGFEFANFLADGATDNLNTALGIPASATDWDTWEGKEYYEQALYLSGKDSGDYYEGQTRLIEDIEIHLFGAVGYLASEFIIKMDSNKDGTVSEAETQAFTSVRTSGSDYGSNDITTTTYLQFVKNGTTPYIIDTSTQTSNCWSDTNYDGIEALNGATGVSMGPTGTGGCGMITATELANGTTLSGTCAVIAKVDDIQQLFSTTVEAGGSVTTFLGSMLTNMSRLSTDLDSLGLESGNDLRDQVDEITDQLDNGGACTSNTTYNEINQVLNLVDASNKTALASGNYSAVNLIETSALVSSSDKNPSIPTSFTVDLGGGKSIGFSCTTTKARLVFNNGSNVYTPDYGSAKNAIKNTFTSLVNIRLDSSGATIPTTKGDQKVSFEELVCAQ